MTEREDPLRRGPQPRPHGADDPALKRAAEIFRAAGDLPRLRLLALLRGGERTVTQLAAATGAKMSTVSQQLRLLRAEDLVAGRRVGKHVFYSLADQHIRDLLQSALAHAGQGERAAGAGTTLNLTLKEFPMSDHIIHEGHEHQHGAECGHTAIQHDGHTDYLHGGHLHHPHEGHVDEHTLEVSATNPDACTPGFAQAEHEAGHAHGPDCGHEAVPHGDHTDYLVDGVLHHPHGDHCDNHGPVTLAA